MQVVLRTPSELVVHDGRWPTVLVGGLFLAMGGGVMWLRWTHPTGWSGNGGPWVVYAVGSMFVLASGVIFWLSADRRYVVDRTAHTVALVVQRLLHRQSTLLAFKDISDVALEESAGISSASNSTPSPTYRVLFLMKDGSRVPWTPYSTNDRLSQEKCAAAVRVFGGWGGTAAEQSQPATPTPALLSHPVATNWGCLAAFLAIFVAVGLGIFTVDLYRIATWRAVTANVVSSDVGTVGGNKGNATYKPVVVYNYRYQGQAYQAATVTPIDLSASQSWAQSIANKYHPGDVTTAYVNPGNPYKVYLLRQVSFFPLLFVLIPICVGLIFSWIVRAQRLQVVLAQKHLVPVVSAA